MENIHENQVGEVLSYQYEQGCPNQVVLGNPTFQDLSMGKTLAAAGHMPRQKFSTQGGVEMRYILQIIIFKILANGSFQKTSIGIPPPQRK